ncbi:MAG: YdcH family protein [Magnetococcales bacterium]|nr:YdcH family protein [Magnetococcales bacterium]
MFEDQLQAVHELLATNKTFKELHDKHQQLKQQIETMGSGSRGDYSVERLKKEKLRLKDQMAVLLNKHTAGQK